jgi:hypothetical protein
VCNALSEATAEVSLADILDRKRLGTAIAEMIKMTATTTRSSINDNPRALFVPCISLSPNFLEKNA